MCTMFCRTPRRAAKSVSSPGMNGSTPALSRVRPRRMLRRFSQPPRHQALSQNQASDHAELRTRRGLGLVLRRSSRLRASTNPAALRSFSLSHDSRLQSALQRLKQRLGAVRQNAPYAAAASAASAACWAFGCSLVNGKLRNTKRRSLPSRRCNSFTIRVVARTHRRGERHARSLHLARHEPWISQGGAGGDAASPSPRRCGRRSPWSTRRDHGAVTRSGYRRGGNS